MTAKEFLSQALDSSEVDGAPIQEVSLSKDGTFKFRLYSKLDALYKLAELLGAGYAWDEDATEDRPIQEADHLMDLIRYFVQTNRLALPPKKPLFPR